ncbi:hypothetical protein HDV00_001600 [Rhizophlyctis rosea]|nr:hypothetical protein HDV00_001600 [Rhizophlyctis rosea]
MRRKVIASYVKRSLVRLPPIGAAPKTAANFGYPKDGLEVFVTNDMTLADGWYYGNALRRLLKASEVLKTGVNIAHDVEVLKEAGVPHVNGAIDIFPLWQYYVEKVQQLPKPTTCPGLKALCRQYLGIRIKPKFPSVCGRTAPLHIKTIKYGALDACASLEVFRFLHNQLSPAQKEEYRQIALAQLAHSRC